MQTLDTTDRYHNISPSHANPCVAVAQDILGRRHFDGRIAYELDAWAEEEPRTLAQLSRTLDLDTGRHVAYCAHTDHVIAIVDGTVHDFGSPMRKRIRMIVTL